MTWQDKVIAATDDMLLGAILRCALGRNPPGPARRQFNGKATVTSDGFVMCDFTDGNGARHMSAFVGAISELYHKVDRLAEHLRLASADRDALKAAIADWIDKDWTK